MEASNLLEVPPQPKIRPDLPSQKKEIDTRWVEIKFSAPFLPRSYFASCIQAGTIYVHGGFSAETGILSDFYSCCLYDQPASWRSLQPKQIKALKPPGLRNHSLNSHLSNLLLVGGQKNVVDNNGEIYRFDLLSNSWTICNCLDSKGKKIALALDSQSTFTYKNYLYILNGYDALSTEYFENILKINLQKLPQDSLSYQILKCEKAKPSPRGNCSFSLAGNYLYLFGGGGNVDDVYGDFWRWKIQQNQWEELKKNETTVAWPDKRKGATLVHHELSNTLFLFGGIKKVTKEQNDVMVYVIEKQKWVRIHSSTNDLYDPSPTLKELAESPTLAEEKRRRQKAKSITQPNSVAGFKIGIQSVMQSGQSRMHETGIDYYKDDSPTKHQATETATQDFRRRVSVVQEKKYRDFLNRKKKLLSQLQSSPNAKKRANSPTSEALIFSLACMGEQPRSEKSQMGLPKVIFDQDKGHVIGKKPCARDGHAALLHDQSMIILGGDRHMVSFNDAYLFRLDKGVQSLPHYQ